MESDGQWSDDFHHALHTVLTGDDRGYFRDFGKIGQLAKAYSDGFVVDGCESAFRERRHGSSSRERPGGRARGVQPKPRPNSERVPWPAPLHAAGHTDEKLALGRADGSPFAATPVPRTGVRRDVSVSYFTSHGDAGLVEAVRSGRKAELEAFGLAEIPRSADPRPSAPAYSIRPASSRRPTPTARVHQGSPRAPQARRALSNARRDLLTVKHDEAQPNPRILRRDPEGSAVLVTLCFARQAAPVRCRREAAVRPGACSRAAPHMATTPPSPPPTSSPPRPLWCFRPLRGDLPGSP